MLGTCFGGVTDCRGYEYTLGGILVATELVGVHIAVLVPLSEVLALVLGVGDDVGLGYHG